MTVSPLLPEDPPAIGPYRLLGRIGQGGQGRVYLGELRDGTRVAVKTLWTGGDDDMAARRRFARELMVARMVPPDYTAAVLDADLDGRTPYIVSEYIPGPSLHRAVAESGPRTGAELHTLAVGTATALAGIHEAGVVHRDFNPRNVLLGTDGPRVVDFGIAQALAITALQSATVMGTYPYMAPEQFAGEAIGPPADMHAWAATLVFAASGRAPYGEDEPAKVMYRVFHEPPRTDPLSGRLRQVVRRCLAKDPQRRPSAREVLEMLGAPAAGRPAAATGPVLRLTVDGRTHHLEPGRPHTVGGPGCTTVLSGGVGELLYLRYRGAWMGRIRVPGAEVHLRGARRDDQVVMLRTPGDRCVIRAPFGGRTVTCELVFTGAAPPAADGGRRRPHPVRPGSSDAGRSRSSGAARSGSSDAARPGSFRPARPSGAPRSSGAARLGRGRETPHPVPAPGPPVVPPAPPGPTRRLSQAADHEDGDDVAPSFAPRRAMALAGGLVVGGGVLLTVVFPALDVPPSLAVALVFLLGCGAVVWAIRRWGGSR